MRPPPPPRRAPAARRAGHPAGAVVSRTEALARTPRVTFSTPELIGSISLKGARIDDVRLAKHKVDHKPELVPVLSPEGTKNPYYAEFGWSSADPAVKLPGPDTVWTADKTTVGAGKSTRLTWDNGQGLVFALDVRSTRSTCSASSRASRTSPTSR